MKPGRELDVLVADKVMGCKVFLRTIDSNERIFLTEPGKDRHSVPRSSFDYWSCQCDPIHIHNRKEGGGIPEYSTDIAAAWKVVEKLRGDDNALQLFGSEKNDNVKRWYAYFSGKYWCEATSILLLGEVSESAPHAICLAALKLVGALEAGMEAGELRAN